MCERGREAEHTHTHKKPRARDRINAIVSGFCVSLSHENWFPECRKEIPYASCLRGTFWRNVGRFQQVFGECVRLMCYAQCFLWGGLNLNPQRIGSLFSLLSARKRTLRIRRMLLKHISCGFAPADPYLAQTSSPYTGKRENVSKSCTYGRTGTSVLFRFMERDSRRTAKDVGGALFAFSECKEREMRHLTEKRRSDKNWCCLLDRSMWKERRRSVGKSSSKKDFFAHKDVDTRLCQHRILAFFPKIETGNFLKSVQYSFYGIRILMN